MKRPKKAARDRAPDAVLSSADELPTTYARRSPDDFEIVTNIQSLRESEGTITGCVAFRLRDEVLPGVFWNDSTASPRLCRGDTQKALPFPRVMASGLRGA